MSLLRWYVLALASAALLLVALAIAVEFRETRGLAYPPSPTETLAQAAIAACGFAYPSTLFLIGLTFAVGLFASVREPSGPLALAPALTVLLIGAVAAGVRFTTWYDVVGYSEAGVDLIRTGAVAAIVPPLAWSVVLGVALLSVVAVLARRAS